MKKQQIVFLVGVISLTILVLNNIGQALIMFGFTLDKPTLNWIALGSLIGSLYFILFKD